MDDSSSRIVVLSPGAEAHTHLSHSNLVGLVRSIVGSDGGAEAQTVEEDGEKILWKIENRYYTADVHFQVLACQLSHTRTRRSRPAVRLPRRDGPPDEVAEEEEGEARSELKNADGDDTLQERARDVFEALEDRNSRPAQIQARRPGTIDDEVAQEVQQHLQGVDAVVIVVDRSQPFSEHEALLASLEESVIGLSGFDLAVSLVVALSPPLRPLEAYNEEGVASVSAPVSDAEQVADLYTGHGWEYVDLLEGEEDALSSSDLDEGLEQEDDEETAEIAEEKGLGRIREALMTHTWPTLVRVDDDETRAARRAHLDQVRNEAGVGQEGSPAALDPGIGEMSLGGPTDESYGDLFDAFVVADDGSASAQPTEHDEELARAFLNRLNEAQRAYLMSQPLGSEAKDQQRSIEDGDDQAPRKDVHQELEDFLQGEDPLWPGPSSNTVAADGIPHQDPASSAITASAGSNTSEAWPKGEETKEGGSEAFEDDFSDFLSGQPYREGITYDEDDEEDIEEELFSTRALASTSHEGAQGRPSSIGFEAALSAVQAQAERVRSIPDAEKRREEAAEVALSFAGMVLGEP